MNSDPDASVYAPGNFARTQGLPLEWWYRLADLTWSTGATAGYMVDRSPAGVNARTGEAPTYERILVGGQPRALVKAESGTFHGVIGRASLVLPQPFTVVTILRQDAHTEDLGLWGGSAGATDPSLEQGENEGDLRMAAGGTEGAVVNLPLGTLAMITTCYRGATSWIRKNATAKVSAAVGTTGITEGFLLGADQADSATVAYAEQFAFGAALTDAQVEQLYYGWAVTAWGLA